DAGVARPGLRSGRDRLRPVLVGLVRPAAGAGLAEEGREVLGRTRLLRATDDGDLRRRQLHAGIVGRDRRVVPGLDLLGGDLGERRSRQLQLVDAVQVVRHGDRRGDGREVQDRSLRLRVARTELAVGAREVDVAAREERLAGARPDALVLDRDVRVGLLEALD